MSKKPGFSRIDATGVRPGAMCGSSREAYAMTSVGTRKPAVSSSITASPLPRCPSASSQLRVAHGVVPCARSPRTVAEPVVQRRPTARYCIGDRSCASSRTTCPREWVRSIRSVASSISTASAGDQAAAFTERAGFAHSTAFCSSSVRIPPACSARKSASARRRRTSLAGSTCGQTDFTSAFTAALRATAFCTRSSGASPARSICTSTACAIRCGSASRAAP